MISQEMKQIKQYILEGEILTLKLFPEIAFPNF